MYPWPEVLFVENANLYLPILERESLDVEKEVEGICSILRELNISPKSKILDLACGIGRHSISLANKGFRVTGVDKSPLYLSIANQKAKLDPSLNSRLKFVMTDIKRISTDMIIKKRAKFDVIISMCQSIGYYGVAYDEKIFSDLTKVASTNCTLIIEVENRDWRVRNFQPYIMYDFDLSQIHEQWILNLETSTAQSNMNFYEKISGSRILRHLKSVNIQIRLYSIHELKELLERNGWKYVNSYGNIKTLEPLSINSEYIVAVFRAKKDSR
jgi:2-polyprenyl-3-methyl-5-hydroxy-6-metoxy-1,4-benzoquinol methylase